MLRERAPAKINLSLRVLGRREDGYHRLESLVGFADVGDELFLEPGPGLALALAGPFAAGLEAEPDNIVLRAARRFIEVFPDALAGRFALTKTLPLASGIGGGSSDAAAALRLLARANGIRFDDPRLMECAGALGADVPVCLDARPRMMRGIGHELGPAMDFTETPALLVNPGVEVETRAVFAALELAHGELFARSASDERNDLEAPAMALAPVIGAVLGVLHAAPGCRLARMSGSGATCFALFEHEAAVLAATAAVRAHEGDWWIAPCRIQVPL